MLNETLNKCSDIIGKAEQAQITISANIIGISSEINNWHVCAIANSDSLKNFL